MSKTTQVVEHDVYITTTETTPEEDAAKKALRKKLFLGLAATVAVLGGGYFAYDALIASRHVETDNAYVGANVAQVTPLVAGPVSEVLVDDAQVVKKGQVLLRLDDTDARIAVAAAEANLALTLRKVRALVATDSGLNAQIAARAADQARADAQMTAAQSDLDKAKIDLDRREALAASGAVSGEELTAARNAYRSALANFKSASAARTQASANQLTAVGTREANRALIDGTTPETNPEVLAAQAALDQARINLERTIIRAPVDGVIARRQVQVGQKVQAGQVLMTLVPVNDLFVDANFKEVQLAKVRPGQSVELTSDLYGKEVVYTGKVVGLGGGTGAAFAVVPAQNATGNWIKVVQRLPVRIALDPAQLRQHPLRVGLSMTADIDVSGE